MWEFLGLAAAAFGVGALHALEPGHGKTVVGAYLIGSKGTSWDAILLGIVVTLTHTGSVIILGVLSTIAAAYFVPEQVEKILEVVSGLLIVAVGGWMIGVRVRQLCRHGHHGHEHPHPHEHEEHFHPLPQEHDQQHHAEPGHDHGHDHTDDDFHFPDDGPGHGHGHDAHDDDHGHGHSHVPVLKPGQRATLWQLLVLGISGGIVPCPAALFVLLAAINVGNFTYGISLLLVFSLGMAAALVAIGIIMVHAAKFAGKYVAESKWTKRVPIISAIIITVVGVVLTIKAIIDVLQLAMLCVSKNVSVLAF